MEVTLHNHDLSVTIGTLGAELHSIRYNGREYLYQPDGIHWDKQSPILFPIIGKLVEGQYQYNGETYPLGKHGFARTKEFRVSTPDETSAIFELTSDMAGEKDAYPFDFKLQVKYELRDHDVIVRYAVANTGIAPMWFSLGGHPAFAVPLEDGLSFEDYDVTVQTDQAPHDLERLPLDGPFIADLEGTPYPKEFPLSHDLFVDDALIFKTSGKTTVSLTSDKGLAKVHVSYRNHPTSGGFPYVGIWSMPDDSPFVCVEPWDGLPDVLGKSGHLLGKVGIQRLAPGGVYRNAFVIAVE